jgi:hypothetical protein
MAKEELRLTAYNVKTKEKGVPMVKPVIDRNGKRCFAKGKSENGDNMCAAVGLERAEKAIKDKVATKGKGW